MKQATAGCDSTCSCGDQPTILPRFFTRSANPAGIQLYASFFLIKEPANMILLRPGSRESGRRYDQTSFRTLIAKANSPTDAGTKAALLIPICDSAFTILSWLKSVLTNVTFMPLFAKHWASSIKGITWPCAGYVGMDEENKEN